MISIFILSIYRSLIAMSLDEPLMEWVYLNFNIRFAKATSYISDFNCHNKDLIANVLKQGYRYHKLHFKAFLGVFKILLLTQWDGGKIFC